MLSRARDGSAARAAVAVGSQAAPHCRRPRCCVVAATVGTAQGACGQPVCLKEWAVTAAALGSGEQTILLRKGGIREPRFTPEARSFFLFPTSFHAEQQLLKPGVAERYVDAMRLEPRQLEAIPLGQYAEVTGAWVMDDERVLEALDPLHVWAGGFLEARLKWRRTQPITLLELRAYDLRPPLLLPKSEALFGCFSWTRLPGVPEAVVEGALAARVPALSDHEFAEKQRLLRERLKGLNAEPLGV